MKERSNESRKYGDEKEYAIVDGGGAHLRIMDVCGVRQQ
jgi:hypothetical protein